MRRRWLNGGMPTAAVEYATEAVRLCLLPFYPFLGLLWSGTQNLLARFGLVPRSLTSISIFTVFCFSFAQACLRRCIGQHNDSDREAHARRRAQNFDE